MKWSLKRWGGGVIIKGKSVCVVVAEYTQKAAVVRLKAAGFYVSLYHFRGFFSETGNQTQILTANRPGVWMVKGYGDSASMKELKA